MTLMRLVSMASTSVTMSLVSSSMAVAMIVSHMTKSSLARGCQSHRYSGHLLEKTDFTGSTSLYIYREDHLILANTEKRDVHPGREIVEETSGRTY